MGAWDVFPEGARVSVRSAYGLIPGVVTKALTPTRRRIRIFRNYQHGDSNTEIRVYYCKELVERDTYCARLDGRNNPTVSDDPDVITAFDRTYGR